MAFQPTVRSVIICNTACEGPINGGNAMLKVGKV